jgi:hypothetical protein
MGAPQPAREAVDARARVRRLPLRASTRPRQGYEAG